MNKAFYAIAAVSLLWIGFLIWGLVKVVTWLTSK